MSEKTLQQSAQPLSAMSNFKRRMDTIFRSVRRKPRSNEIMKPLMEKNNNTNTNVVDGNDRAAQGCDNPTAQDTFTQQDRPLKREQSLTLQELVERLEVSSDIPPVPSEDGSLRQTFCFLHHLLPNISSPQNSLVLMKWVLSQEKLGHPDRRLLSEWEAKAKDRLLENVQKEVERWLDKILQTERSKERCDVEEAYVRLYADTIQCVDAIPKEARKISSELCDQVREACFQELLVFVRRYTVEQTKVLGENAAMDQPETIHFLKTLKTCKELKRHVQTEGNASKSSLLKEIVEPLESMEASTLKLLMGIVTNMAERHLQNYFKSDSSQLSLLVDLKQHFPKLYYASDEQKIVMGEAHKIITHTYLKHLIRSSQRKLKKHWSPTIGETVREDADLLHNTISDLAPGVEHWNLMRLWIPEVLTCESLDMLKLILAKMQEDCGKQSEDLELLYGLLRWNGLARYEVREVLDALPGSEPRPSSGCCFSCLRCS